ncbi:MAG: hypothetical protein AB1489_33910 [Acidobacteriota bacterium]
MKKSLNTKQLQIAAQIDARVRELERAGNNEMTIFVETAPLMPSFKKLLDTAGEGEMDELCSRYDGFYRYAKILDNIAAGIHSGEIKVE